MTHPSKSKGNRYERELVNQASDSGLAAKRAYASNGESLGECEEVDLMVAGKRIQAKRRRSLPKSLTTGPLRLDDGVDAVVAREDGGESIVILSWWEYLDLLKAEDLNR